MSFHLLREYTNNHVQNVGRNMDSKGHSDEVSDRNKECVLDNGEKEILVIKWQRTWLNCVYVLEF